MNYLEFKNRHPEYSVFSYIESSKESIIYIAYHEVDLRNNVRLRIPVIYHENSKEETLMSFVLLQLSKKIIWNQC